MICPANLSLTAGLKSPRRVLAGAPAKPSLNHRGRLFAILSAPYDDRAAMGRRIFDHTVGPAFFLPARWRPPVVGRAGCDHRSLWRPESCRCGGSPVPAAACHEFGQFPHERRRPPPKVRWRRPAPPRQKHHHARDHRACRSFFMLLRPWSNAGIGNFFLAVVGAEEAAMGASIPRHQTLH